MGKLSAADRRRLDLIRIDWFFGSRDATVTVDLENDVTIELVRLRSGDEEIAKVADPDPSSELVNLEWRRSL